MNHRRSFKAGEKQCAACGDALPAFESNSQKTYACAKKECRTQVYKAFIQKTRDIKAGEVICSLEGCTRPVPPCTVQERRTMFFCCATHEKKHYQNTEVGKCLCCGEPILDFPFMMGRRQYVNNHHRFVYQSQLRLDQLAGPFAPVINQFMDGEGKTYYAATTWKAARNYFIRFFAWIREQNVDTLDGITIDLITRYMQNESERGVTTDVYLGHISTLFGWARIRGLMTIPSPIIRRFHRVRKAHKRARAYSDEQVRGLWDVLEERGTVMMKAVVAVGLEAGCRISETGALRLSEVDFKRQTLFIAKSKNGEQRYTHFGDKTRLFLEAWLRERDPHCGHDLVFYNDSQSRIPTSGYLQTKIRDTVRRSNSNPNGVESFHTHALRHTWATNLVNAGMDPMTLMTLGGWKSWEAMKVYVRVSQERVEAQFHEADRRGREERLLQPLTVVGLADLLDDSSA